MRIKCPNSDIYLELPGDRSDMKFTCPACHKVHRVTVTITTPSKEPHKSTGNTRSVTQVNSQMPKKYATGAFAPVVDIPIDANFVLMDGEVADQPGIDLGSTAESMKRKDGLFNRQTEIIQNKRPEPGLPSPEKPELEPKSREEPPPKSVSPGNAGAKSGIGPSETEFRERLAASEETTKDKPPPAIISEGRHQWSETPEKPRQESRSTREILRDRDPENKWNADASAQPETPHPTAREERRSTRAFAERDPEDNWQENTPSPVPARRRQHTIAKSVLYVLLGALIIALCYLGWQQYLFESNHRKIGKLMEVADTAWKKGEISAAAVSARAAATAVDEGKSYFTFGVLWDRMAEWTGLFAPRSPSSADTERRIRAHIEREKALQSFKEGLDPTNTSAMAQSLFEAAVKARADGDHNLALAMEREVYRTSMDSLAAEAPTTTPEKALAKGEIDRETLASLFSPPLRGEFLGGLGEFTRQQHDRLTAEIKQEIASLARDAADGKESALIGYRALTKRLERAPFQDLAGPIPDLAENPDHEAILQLSRLDGHAAKATSWARSVFSRPENDESGINELIAEAAADDHPYPAMAEAAARLMEENRSEAEDLLRIRSEVFSRMQSELRRNRNYSGTRLAWSMLRLGFDDAGVEIDPGAFKFDTVKAAISLTMDGIPVVMEMDERDYDKTVRARIYGYTFTTGWTLLFHKPLSWMAKLAAEMREAGVDAEKYPAWELLEGPGGPLALLAPEALISETAFANANPPPRRIFFSGQFLPVTELPQAESVRQVVQDFRQTAMSLHDGIIGDETIPQPLRQALKPILEGTYQKPDARDYFDSAFCRRLIEANYLETFIKPLPEPRRKELAAYRETLDKLEAGYDEFYAEMDDGTRIYAITRLEADLEGTDGGDQDPDTGESLPRCTWRVEKHRETVFYSPLPSRFVYAFMLAEHYDGLVKIRPTGSPKLTEVWHATKGKIASYAAGAEKADGNPDLWNSAIAEDLSGRFDPTMGPPGWNFPLHVLQRDDQGDPIAIATLSGVVKSPDFSAMRNPSDRRKSQDEWLSSTARILSTPGELGLIFHQFFRYCSDSPLPELPNLIGSHYGLSDTHQTVYESLDRRWVGRLIGDCDDLAEFFQDLTQRQGKLSHVMQLPGHAACGYVDSIEGEGGYRFIVLQTGPVLQFTAPSLNESVELAYRAFDRDGGISHMTTDAVPLLLRFANEDTRTPFVLSARIYGDREYAETMIRVQAYWHEHTYSAAMRIMEAMVEEDQEIGNIKELGSLYERVGMYDKSERMRRRELEMVKGKPQATLSTLLELVQLHFQDKDRDKALTVLGQMENEMLAMIRKDDAPEFFRAMTFRSYWAIFLSRLGHPARAWNLIRYDVRMTKQQAGRIADPVLRTLVIMYDYMCMARDSGRKLSPAEEKALQEMKKELDESMGRGYFKADDSYNAIIGRYFVLGRFAVADAGRKTGLGRLRQDGPYPDRPKDQTQRRRALDEDDWRWLRITPQLYLTLGLEMLDEDEYPERYNPEDAKPLLEDVARAVAKGTGLGSDVAGGDDIVKSEIILSFLNRDLEAFRRSLIVVKEKNYSSLYDETALTFGMFCGLIPLDQFPEWGSVFHDFYPGEQHYFKVVYRALDKGHYDHALLMAETTARFFPNNRLLQQEAEFVRSIIPSLKERKPNGRIDEQSAVEATSGVAARPAA